MSVLVCWCWTGVGIGRCFGCRVSSRQRMATALNCHRLTPFLPERDSQTFHFSGWKAGKLMAAVSLRYSIGGLVGGF